MPSSCSKKNLNTSSDLRVDRGLPRTGNTHTHKNYIWSLSHVPYRIINDGVATTMVTTELLSIATGTASCQRPPSLGITQLLSSSSSLSPSSSPSSQQLHPRSDLSAHATRANLNEIYLSYRSFIHSGANGQPLTYSLNSLASSFQSLCDNAYIFFFSSILSLTKRKNC